MKLYHFYSYFYALKEIKRKNSKLEKGGWVVDSLNIYGICLYFLPIIKYAKGHLCISNNCLQSLNGCPKIIDGNFYCYSNQLKNLNGGPNIVNGDYICFLNKLETLDGMPEKIKEKFDCSFNKNLGYGYMKNNFNKIKDKVGKEFLHKSCF